MRQPALDKAAAEAAINTATISASWSPPPSLADLPSCDVEQIECLVETDGMLAEH
jgi:hypothetical protein